MFHLGIVRPSNYIVQAWQAAPEVTGVQQKLLLLSLSYLNLISCTNFNYKILTGAQSLWSTMRHWEYNAWNILEFSWQLRGREAEVPYMLPSDQHLIFSSICNSGSLTRLKAPRRTEHTKHTLDKALT